MHYRIFHFFLALLSFCHLALQASEPCLKHKRFEKDLQCKVYSLKTVLPFSFLLVTDDPILSEKTKINSRRYNKFAKRTYGEGDLAIDNLYYFAQFNEYLNLRRLASIVAVEQNMLICEWRLANKDYTPAKTQEKMAEARNDFYTICKNIDLNRERVTQAFLDFYSCNCREKSLQNIYDRGLLQLSLGHTDEALNLAEEFIDEANNHPDPIKCIESNYCLFLGITYAEALNYNKAIEYLSEAISKDPENKLAYFHRAAAYFETGNFDSAIDDYLHSDKEQTIVDTTFQISQEFKDAFLTSALEGSAEALVEFVPNLLDTVYGATRMHWASAPHPINHVLFAAECYKMGEFLNENYKNFDWKDVDDHVEEVKTLCNQFMDLSDSQKGALIGHLVGKYGTDIFAGVVLFRGVTIINNLRNINKLCTLESMALSAANKESIVTSAVEHAAKRTEYFKNAWIHVDKQNKHVPGKHNFLQDRGKVIHKEPESLLKKHAGTGKKLSKAAPGEGGYKEIVDFEELIGYWKNDKSPIELPTTKGVIHYSKDGGAHIVPAHPDSKVH